MTHASPPFRTTARTARGPLVQGWLVVAFLLLVSCRGGCTGSCAGDAPPAPCDDGDPCTVDLFHEVEDRCLNIPDRFCSKDCETDADCSYPVDEAPCRVASCVAGSCRFTEIAKDECARCSTDADCAGSFCDPRDCRDGFCRHAPRDCGDGDPNTWDRCSDELESCQHFLADGRRSCTTAEDCGTDHPCQEFACTEGLCRLSPETADCSPPLDLPRQCGVNQDCIQSGGPVCIAGPCDDGFCEWREVPESVACKPCVGDHQCPGTFCRWPVCTGTVCTQEVVPFCEDRDPATVDTCSDEVSACLHEFRSTPPLCSGAPVDDDKPETVDVCDVASGQTLHLPRAEGRCKTSNRCFNTYEGPDGFCLGEALECHCKDDQVCPSACDPDLGCVLEPEDGGPCSSDEDCSLGSECARMVCVPGQRGFCWGTLLSDCVPCNSDQECFVDGWCVGGTCDPDGYCTYFDLITCDDGDPCTVGFCHGQHDDPCTFEEIPGCRE